MYQLRDARVEKFTDWETTQLWELPIERSTDWRLNQFGDVPIEESTNKGILQIESLAFNFNQKIILNFDFIFTEI